MKEKIINWFKEYWPDIIVLIGVYITSYNILRPAVKYNMLPKIGNHIEYFTEYKVLGIVLIAVGLDVCIRRYFKK